MRADEAAILSGDLNLLSLNRKRRAYLVSKWVRRGWWSNNDWTAAGLRINELIKLTHDGSDYLYSLNKHICILYTINWMPPVCGIMVDCGDNGFHFFTRKVFRWPGSDSGLWSANGGYFLGDYSCSESMKTNVAWIEQHRSPAKLWEMFNRLAYLKNPKYNKDYWHQHMQPYDYATNSYAGCLPTCQCKSLIDS